MSERNVEPECEAECGVECRIPFRGDCTTVSAFLCCAPQRRDGGLLTRWADSPSHPCPSGTPRSVSGSAVALDEERPPSSGSTGTHS